MATAGAQVAPVATIRRRAAETPRRRARSASRRSSTTRIERERPRGAAQPEHRRSGGSWSRRPWPPAAGRRRGREGGDGPVAAYPAPRDPEQRADAHALVRAAVLNGRLTPPARRGGDRCGRPAAVYHHPRGYDLGSRARRGVDVPPVPPSLGRTPHRRDNPPRLTIEYYGPGEDELITRMRVSAVRRKEPVRVLGLAPSGTPSSASTGRSEPSRSARACSSRAWPTRAHPPTTPTAGRRSRGMPVADRGTTLGVLQAAAGVPSSRA